MTAAEARGFWFGAATVATGFGVVFGALAFWTPALAAGLVAVLAAMVADLAGGGDE